MGIREHIPNLKTVKDKTKIQGKLKKQSRQTTKTHQSVLGLSWGTL